jgi:hypothetical protein
MHLNFDNFTWKQNGFTSQLEKYIRIKWGNFYGICFQNTICNSDNRTNKLLKQNLQNYYTTQRNLSCVTAEVWLRRRPPGTDGANTHEDARWNSLGNNFFRIFIIHLLYSFILSLSSFRPFCVKTVAWIKFLPLGWHSFEYRVAMCVITWKRLRAKMT